MEKHKISLRNLCSGSVSRAHGKAARFKHTALALVLAALPLSTPAFADKAMLVLDASGSMNAQINGKPKLQIAREVVNGLVQEWPQATELGLIAYGHREKDNCGDIQTLVKPASDSWPAIKAAVGDVEAKGKTPITEAVRAAARELKSEEGKATVILVSDGLETCNADPCAAAAELKKSGVDFTVHVVGFGTTPEENRQLSCIADSTGGRFLGAKDAPELKTAMTKTAQLVAKPEPVAATTSSATFVDSFDGSEPGKQWEIQKENKQTYIIENGSLLLATNKSGGLKSGNAENVFVLNDVSLDGDWDMSVKIRPSFATQEDFFQVGTWGEDGEGSIRATLSWSHDTNCQWITLGISSFDGSTQSKSEAAFAINIAEGATFRSGYCTGSPGKEDAFRRLINNLKEKGATLTLSKRGRAYRSQFTSPFTSPKQTQEISVVRSIGRPVFGLSQREETNGQTSVLIDEFRMMRVK